MNVNEYISSGIVESYVFGLASADEQAEFEQMCAEHPEVKAAREAFELLIEKQALSQAVAPPADLKDKIFQHIGVPKTELTPLKSVRTTPAIDKPQGRVVQISVARFIAAASVVLLIVSTALNFYFFYQYKNYSGKYEQLVENQNQLASTNQALQTKMQSYESALNLIKDPGMAVVKLTGVPAGPDPSGQATVYWNTSSKDVYLLVNNMPEAGSGKQYQLWALVDGKPVDAGMVDAQNGLALIKMKNIPKAQAFAVTLEKQGGSPTPTMPIYVLGKVS